MRRIKARVYRNKKGEVTAAFPKDYACIEENIAADRVTEEAGYIEIALKKGRSREKGNTFEREVAKTFSRWIYGREDVIRRTPLSGGFSGYKMGDVFADPALLQELSIKQPKLHIECKHYADLLQHSFFRWQCSGEAGLIGGWITDTATKAKGAPWFLALKGNGTDPWLLTDEAVDGRFDCINVWYKQMPYSMAPLVSLAAAYPHVKAEILGN